jgi:hypothetical protein
MSRDVNLAVSFAAAAWSLARWRWVRMWEVRVRNICETCRLKVGVLEKSMRERQRKSLAGDHGRRFALRPACRVEIIVGMEDLLWNDMEL